MASYTEKRIFNTETIARDVKLRLDQVLYLYSSLDNVVHLTYTADTKMVTVLRILDTGVYAATL